MSLTDGGTETVDLKTVVNPVTTSSVQLRTAVISGTEFPLQVGNYRHAGAGWLARKTEKGKKKKKAGGGGVLQIPAQEPEETKPHAVLHNHNIFV